MLCDSLTTLEEIEKALDSGRLMVRKPGNSWGRIRRNGKTQKWKTRPDDYRIPWKHGMYQYGAVTPRDVELGQYSIEENSDGRTGVS